MDYENEFCQLQVNIFEAKNEILRACKSHKIIYDILATASSL